MFYNNHTIILSRYWKSSQKSKFSLPEKQKSLRTVASAGLVHLVILYIKKKWFGVLKSKTQCQLYILSFDGLLVLVYF